MLHAREVRVIHFNDKPLDSPVVKGVNVFLGAYFLIAGASILLISIDNMSTTTNLTAVLSCIGNIGPGLDQVGPMSNYSGFSNFSKLVLSADMLLGRLEIFPILLLFSPSTWQHRPNIHLSMVAEQFDDN